MSLSPQLSEPQKVINLKGNQLVFRPLNRQLEQLKTQDGFTLSDCHNVSSEELIKLLEDGYLDNVSRLCFNCCIGVDDNVLAKLSLSTSLQNLKILDLARCRWFSDEGLQKLFEAPIAGQIQELSLSKCSCVTDNTLKIMASSQSLKNIEVLNLAKCYEVTNRGVRTLVLSENVSKLKVLNLTKCWRISDEALEEMTNSKFLQNLEELYLTGLNYITNIGIQHIACSANFSQLKTLSVAACFLLDDTAVRSIAESTHFANLEELNLNYNSKITSVGIEYLWESENLLAMKALYIKDIYLSLRADKVMALSQQFPQLKSFSFNSEGLKYFMSSENIDEISEIHYGSNGHFADDKVFHEYGKNLKKVIIEKDFPYELNLPIFRNIKVLCLSAPNLTDEIFLSLLSHSFESSLTIIKLVNLKITEFGIKTLLSSVELMENVKSLELRYIRHLSNQCLKMFSKNKAVKLTELRIQGDPEYFGDIKLDASGLSSLILSPVCTNVKTLELKDLGLEEDILKYIAISEDMARLEELILDKNFQEAKPSAAKDQQQAFNIFFGEHSKLKALKMLSLKDCPALTSKAFEEIVQVYKANKGLPALESIRIDFTETINPKLLKEISTYSTFASAPELVLRHLKKKEQRSHFDDLFQFCSRHSQLLLIELYHIDFLTDKHLRSLSDLKAINCLRTLKIRDIKDIDGSFLNHWANSESASFTQLQKIHLINLNNFRSDGLEAFVNKVNLEGLMKLEIRTCHHIGDEFLQALAASTTVRKLHRLALASLPGVSDSGIGTLVNSQVANNLRVLELKDLRRVHAETLEAIAKSKNLEKLMTLQILNCQQIDSSKMTVIFDAASLVALANLVIDSPIIPNDTFLKSFVFTKLRNLVHFSLKFTGDFPRDGILELLRKPNVHMKHIVLAELVGSNLETIANDELIDLLIKSDFVDICLSLNTNDKPEIHRISAERLLDVAQNSEFSLEKFLQNYGGLIDDQLLAQMGRWKLPEDDYWRRKVLVVKKDPSSDSPKKRISMLDTPNHLNSRVDTPTKRGFLLKIQENVEERIETPGIRPEDGPKYINFLAHLPSNYNFMGLQKVTSEGIAKIVQFLPLDIDVLTFMNNHKDILDDKIFSELVKKPSFRQVTSLPFEKFKLLTRESYKLIYSSDNKFFYTRMFEFAKSSKYKLDLNLLSSVAKSKEFLNVEVIKVSKSNIEMNCFDGLKEIFQSQFNDNVKKIIFMDIYAAQLSFELVKEPTITLKNLEAITVKYASNDNYTNGLRNLILSRKFAQIKHLHFHKCSLTTGLSEALATSHYAQELTQLFLDKCIDEDFLVPFSKLKNLKKLTELKFKNMFMPLEFFENLRVAQFSIENLILYQIKLSKGNGDILLLVSQMKNSKIKQLAVDGVKVSSRAIESMNNNPVFSELRYLELSDDTSKINQKRATKQVHHSKGIKESFVRMSRQMTKKTIIIQPAFSLGDFKKLIDSDFLKTVKELKLLYTNLTDEWIDDMIDSNKLENIVSLEFHPECRITAIGMALIIQSRKKLFKSLDLATFLEKNSKLIDDALLLYLCHRRKIHYLNKINLETDKITSEGLVNMLRKLNLNSNPKFKLADFLNKVNEKVNDTVFEALSEQTFALVLKDEDLSIFKNVKQKSVYQLRVLMMDSEEAINQLLREVPNIVDDEFIDTICRSAVFNQTDNSDGKKIVNIKLDANLHTHVTSKGLNTLIQKMCHEKFTVYHDWILLEDYWRNLLNPESLRLIADDNVCRSESLDLVNELDFEHNYYVSTNGYQHLIRKELKNFQKSQELEQKDKYLLADTEDFLKKLNNNRFQIERTEIDDEIGECLLKIIIKCKHLKKINFKNKNFGDKFFRNLSILLCKNTLHFLEEMNFCDNPRLTSTGLKYIYTAVVGNDTIKRILLNCNPELQPEINTIVDDGLYIFTKRKILALKEPGRKKLDARFFLLCFYMIVAFPFAIWQYYEDRILKSRRFAQIKEIVKYIESPFIQPKKRRHMSILPISETLVPHYNDNIQKKAEKILNTDYQTVVPAENFYFTKNTIKLNQALKESKSIFWIYLFNFIIYYILCIAVPILLNGDGCEAGMKTIGFVIYGIYALAIFVFEVLFYKFMVDTLDDTRALRFGIFPILHLLISQTAKFDLFTDVIFVVNLNACDNIQLTIPAAIFVFISILFNAVSTILTACSIWQSKNTHFSSHINRYAKISLSTELHAIGMALDKFSTSNCVKWRNVYMSQIMVSAISKFIFEDFPQFVLQLVKIFAFSNTQANIGITLASTILSLILSFRTAMKARPSVCKAEQVERLIKTDGRRVGQTNILDVEMHEEENSPNVIKKKSSSRTTFDEDEENLLARLQNSKIAKDRPDQDVEIELLSEVSCSDNPSQTSLPSPKALD